MRDSAVSRMNILAMAEEEFAGKGLAGARIDEIAQRASINKRMLYAYFGNKENLYKAVLRNVMDRFAAGEAAALAAELPCVEYIRHAVRFYFEYLHSNPTYVKLLLWENLNEGRCVSEAYYRTNRSAAFRRIAEVIERGKADGVFRREVVAGDAILSLIAYPFCFFSNRYTLSKLLGYDIGGEAALRRQVEDAERLFLSYLCQQ